MNTVPDDVVVLLLNSSSCINKKFFDVMGMWWPGGGGNVPITCCMKVLKSSLFIYSTVQKKKIINFVSDVYLYINTKKLYQTQNHFYSEDDCMSVKKATCVTAHVVPAAPKAKGRPTKSRLQLTL